MKQQYISSFARFIATRQSKIPALNVPASRLFYQVFRRSNNEHMGYIFIDDQDGRAKFCAACLVYFAGADLLDLQCLVTKIKDEYRDDKK